MQVHCQQTKSAVYMMFFFNIQFIAYNVSNIKLFSTSQNEKVSDYVYICFIPVNIILRLIKNRLPIWQIGLWRGYNQFFAENFQTVLLNIVAICTKYNLRFYIPAIYFADLLSFYEHIF